MKDRCNSRAGGDPTCASRSAEAGGAQWAGDGWFLPRAAHRNSQPERSADGRGQAFNLGNDRYRGMATTSRQVPDAIEAFVVPRVFTALCAGIL